MKEHYEIIESQRANKEVVIRAQQSYQALLKGLASIEVYPKFIETRKSSLRDTYFNINQRGDQ